MRGPDPAAGHRGGGGEPDEAQATLRALRASEQADGGEAGEGADQARQDDQAPIMVLRDAGENAKHP
jgi:hypothetical protein